MIYNCMIYDSIIYNYMIYNYMIYNYMIDNYITVKLRVTSGSIVLLFLNRKFNIIRDESSERLSLSWSFNE